MIGWIVPLQARLGSATDGGIYLNEASTIDPLKKRIAARFRDPIPGKDAWIAFQIIVHAFAAANDCVVQKIKKLSDADYIIDVLIKNHRRSSAFDPFVDPWKSNASKRKEAFMKFLREKTEELKKEATDEPEPTSPLPSDINLWCR